MDNELYKNVEKLRNATTVTIAWGEVGLLIVLVNKTNTTLMIDLEHED